MNTFKATKWPKTIHQTLRGINPQKGKRKPCQNFARFALNTLAFTVATTTHCLAFAQGDTHLLDPHRERDDPIPLYKSTWEILEENWWFFVIIGTIILFAPFGWWLKRQFQKGAAKANEPPRRDPYEEAIEALNSLGAKRRQMEAKPFMFRLSEVLRVYVERRFELPAMELTGEEFLREAAEHKFFRNHYDDLLHEFVDRSDIVKYSRESMDGEGLRLLLNSATHFVKDTHRRLEENSAMSESQQEVAVA